MSDRSYTTSSWVIKTNLFMLSTGIKYFQMPIPPRLFPTNRNCPLLCLFPGIASCWRWLWSLPVKVTPLISYSEVVYVCGEAAGLGYPYPADQDKGLSRTERGHYNQTLIVLVQSMELPHPGQVEVDIGTSDEHSLQWSLSSFVLYRSNPLLYKLVVASSLTCSSGFKTFFLAVLGYLTL